MTEVILLAVLLQSAAPVNQTDLPISLDRIREGLERPGRFTIPPPRPWRRPLFRTSIVQTMPLEGNAWDEDPVLPEWIDSARRPAYHIDFLQGVTPDEVGLSSVRSCCTGVPVLAAVQGFISKRVQAAKRARAKREVEAAMRAIGIKR